MAKKHHNKTCQGLYSMAQGHRITRDPKDIIGEVEA